MAQLDRITQQPAVMGGRACIRGWFTLGAHNTPDALSMAYATAKIM